VAAVTAAQVSTSAVGYSATALAPDMEFNLHFSPGPTAAAAPGVPDWLVGTQQIGTDLFYVGDNPNRGFYTVFKPSPPPPSWREMHTFGYLRVWQRPKDRFLEPPVLPPLLSPQLNPSITEGTTRGSPHHKL